MELTGWSRKKSSLVNAIAIILLSLPCVLGYNVWSWDWLKVFGGAILDLEDFLVSNILLPLGSLVYLLFLCFQTGLGLGKLHRRSQHRKRHEDPEMDARIHHLCPAADHSVYLLLWSVR